MKICGKSDFKIRLKLDCVSAQFLNKGGESEKPRVRA
jgi:hypothetical protein